MTAERERRRPGEKVRGFGRYTPSVGSRGSSLGFDGGWYRVWAVRANPRTEHMQALISFRNTYTW